MAEPVMSGPVMSGPATPSPVHIRVSSDPAMSRVLRLAAGGVGSLAGFTVDEIEDIKVAVSEVLLALVEHGDGAIIDIELAVTDFGFEVHGRTPVQHFDADHPDLLLCRTVLAGFCSRHGVEHWNGAAHIWASVARTPSE